MTAAGITAQFPIYYSMKKKRYGYYAINFMVEKAGVKWYNRNCKAGRRIHMENWSREAEKIMIERFGRDTLLALATTENGVPSVRNVNAYYEDGAFYIIT